MMFIFVIAKHILVGNLESKEKQIISSIKYYL